MANLNVRISSLPRGRGPQTPLRPSRALCSWQHVPKTALGWCGQPWFVVGGPAGCLRQALWSDSERPGRVTRSLARTRDFRYLQGPHGPQCPAQPHPTTLSSGLSTTPTSSRRGQCWPASRPAPAPSLPLPHTLSQLRPPLSLCPLGWAKPEFSSWPPGRLQRPSQLSKETHKHTDGGGGGSRVRCALPPATT